VIDEPTDIQRQEELRRIVEAARDVLERTSYENLKIQSVIRRADVSIGSFYRHFGGKRELIVALLGEELVRATGVLDTLTATGTPSERVRAWVDAVISLAFGRNAGPRARWYTTLPADVRTLTQAGIGPAGDTAAPLRRAIEDGRTSGAFPAADPARDALLVQSLCSRLDEGGAAWVGATREEAVARVADFVLAALANPVRGGPEAPS
jgi:AcrR family transcriptional regulator